MVVKLKQSIRDPKEIRKSKVEAVK